MDLGQFICPLANMKRAGGEGIKCPVMKHHAPILVLAAISSHSLFAQNTCPQNAGLGDWSAGPNWNGWGASITNTRFQSAEGAQIAPEAVSRLKLKWAFGFPGAKAVYGQPTVAGGRVFLGVDTGSVYSIDASTGCMYWMYKAAAAVRSAISVGSGRTPGEHLAYFGDLAGNAYALNAATGEQVWKTQVEIHPAARITGAPQLYQNRLYIPVASLEEANALDPAYQCCTFRGSVVAVDALTGRQIWQT